MLGTELGSSAKQSMLPIAKVSLQPWMWRVWEQDSHLHAGWPGYLEGERSTCVINLLPYPITAPDTAPAQVAFGTYLALWNTSLP